MVALLAQGDYKALARLSRTHKPTAQELTNEVNSYRLTVGQLPDEVFNKIAVFCADEDFEIVGGQRCVSANEPLPLEIYIRLGSNDHYFMVAECFLYTIEGAKSDLVLFLEYREPGKTLLVPHTIYLGGG